MPADPGQRRIRTGAGRLPSAPTLSSTNWLISSNCAALARSALAPRDIEIAPPLRERVPDVLREPRSRRRRTSTSSKRDERAVSNTARSLASNAIELARCSASPHLDDHAACPRLRRFHVPTHRQTTVNNGHQRTVEIGLWELASTRGHQESSVGHRFRRWPRTHSEAADRSQQSSQDRRQAWRCGPSVPPVAGGCP